MAMAEIYQEVIDVKDCSNLFLCLVFLMVYVVSFVKLVENWSNLYSSLEV